MVGRRIIERAPGDGTATGRVEGVLIAIERTLEPVVGRVALIGRPAIVGSARAIIDFLECAFAHVIDEQATRARLEGGGEGIAQTHRPDGFVDAAGAVVERIVRRDGAVGIEAEDFPSGVWSDWELAGILFSPTAR